MDHSRTHKWMRSRGISRITAILLVLVIVMSVVVSIPTVKYYRDRSARLACAAGLDTARRRLAQDYLSGDFTQTNVSAVEAVAVAMNGWEDLCPSGGKVYLVENRGEGLLDGQMPYDLVCGMHGADKKQCTRLNAGYVLDQLREGLRTAARNGDPAPASLTFTLNGKTRKAQRTDEEVPFKRGTATTKGYEGKGIVAFYGVAGQDGAWADAGGKAGEICYFSFADEDHCAAWQADDGWTGDSYGMN